MTKFTIYFLVVALVLGLVLQEIAAQRWPSGNRRPQQRKGQPRGMRPRFQNVEMPADGEEQGQPDMSPVQDGGDEEAGGEDFMPDESTRRDCAQLGDDWSGVNEDLQQMGVNLANAKCYLVNGNELHIISEEIINDGQMGGPADEQGGPTDAVGGANPSQEQGATGGEEVELQKRRGRGVVSARSQSNVRRIPLRRMPQRRAGSPAVIKSRSPIKSHQVVATRRRPSVVTRPTVTTKRPMTQKQKKN